MAAKAYILIRTAPGLTKAIYSSLKLSPAVRAVEMITGPHDLIVTIEAATTSQILTTVINDIRPAAGVRDTVTCLVVPGEDLDEGAD